MQEIKGIQEGLIDNAAQDEGSIGESALEAGLGPSYSSAVRARDPENASKVSAPKRRITPLPPTFRTTPRRVHHGSRSD
jgi:hypothetical protein